MARRFNIGDRSPEGLSQCGEFEGLFRVLRQLLTEFVLDEAGWRRVFDPATPAEARAQLIDDACAHPYWPVAFELAFHERLLVVMFGPAAVQHAEPGSYPGYFQRVFERGLRREQGHRNPFLQHVLLGAYRDEDAPAFLRAGRDLELTLIEGDLGAIDDLASFDLISLSNLFDWSDEAEVAAHLDLLQRARPGATLLIRQLNNSRPLALEPHWRRDSALAERLLADDRSLFYERLIVAQRTEHRR